LSQGDPSDQTRRPTAVDPESFPWFEHRHYSFSLGVSAGDSLWLSGHSASTHDPRSGHITVGGGMYEQARVAYEKVAFLLEAAGMRPSDVRHVVEYLNVDGLALYGEAEQARREVLGEAVAATTVLVKSLLRPRALLEVEVTASKGVDQRLAAGEVVLPALEAVDSDGEIVAPGDLVGQAEHCFEQAARLLEGLGLSMAQIVRTTDFTTPVTRREYRLTGAVRRTHLGPIYPAAAGILMPRLGHPEALFRLLVVANRNPVSAVRTRWARYDRLTYSAAVRAGDLIYCSGLAALDPETETAKGEGDVVAQAEFTYHTLVEVLEAAGVGPSSLVRTVEYVTPAGLDRYRGVAEVRKRLLSEPYPASTGLVCEALLRPEFLLEVEATAVVP